MHMKTRRYFLFCGLLVGQLVWPVFSFAQVSPTKLVSIWLQASCPVGEKGQLEAQLAQAGTAVEPALISAAQNGPDSNTLLQIQTSAGTTYDIVQSWIVPNGAEIGLSADDIQLVQAQSRDQYVADAVQDATIAYQSRALVGLGIIADSTAVQVLQTFASNDTSPLQAVATSVLARIFSTFSVKVEVSPRGFELNETFALRADSDGINPVSEAVILQVGTFSGAIPSSSFVAQKNGTFAFEGVIDGVNLEVHIRPLGNNSFAFNAEGRGVDLSAQSNPVTVALTIGNNRGRTTVSAQD